MFHRIGPETNLMTHVLMNCCRCAVEHTRGSKMKMIVTIDNVDFHCDPQKRFDFFGYCTRKRIFVALRICVALYSWPFVYARIKIPENKSCCNRNAIYYVGDSKSVSPKTNLIRSPNSTQRMKKNIFGNYRNSFQGG